MIVTAFNSFEAVKKNKVKITLRSSDEVHEEVDMAAEANKRVNAALQLEEMYEGKLFKNYLQI